MTRENSAGRNQWIVAGVVVPLVVALIGGAFALAGSRRSPGSLVVENVAIEPGDGPAERFGRWMLSAYSESEFNGLKNRPPSYDGVDGPDFTGTFDKNCVQRSHPPPATLQIPGWIPLSNLPLRPNNLRTLLYHADWMYLPELPADWQEFVDSHHPQFFSTHPPARNQYGGWCWALNAILADPDSSFVRPPGFRLVFRNVGGRPVTIFGFVAEPVASFGGEAGAGGAEVKPVGDVTEIRVGYDHPSTAPLSSPVVVDPDITTMLRVRLRVEDAAQGEGPGVLVYRLYADVFNGKDRSRLLVGNFMMADDVSALMAP